MKNSESIKELAMALSKAQGAMGAAHKDATNPHLRNTYASLSSIIDTAKGPLSTNGLAFVQLLSQSEVGMILETVLMHSSGQWLSSEILVNAAAANKGVNEAQALGSALTYYKRYALAAMLGVSVADEDDDGNAAGQSAKKQPAKQEVQVQNPRQDSTQPKQEQPKTNGHDKKPADVTTQFWLTAKEMDLTKEKAQAILKSAGNDFAVALDRLTGTTLRQAQDSAQEVPETGDGGY